MNIDSIIFIYNFWIYYLAFGLMILYGSFMTLLSVVDIGKLVMREAGSGGEKSELKNITNFTIIMFFWPVASALIILVAYLISKGEIDEDDLSKY